MSDTDTNKPKRTYKRPGKSPTPPKPEDKPLDTREEAFVREYMIHLQPMRAALAAGYTLATARTNAYTWTSDNKTKPHVYKAVQQALDERAKATEITAEAVLRRWWQLATADPNELTQLRRECCRHCFGIDHAFQWIDDDEFQAAIDEAAEKDKDAPHNAGGYGFDANLPPHPKCPQCHGKGIASPYMADTRQLSPEAQVLFAGVEQTKDGLKIKMHDQARALEQVARHLGMYKDDVTLGVQDGSPLGRLLEQISGNTLKPRDDA